MIKVGSLRQKKQEMNGTAIKRLTHQGCAIPKTVSHCFEPAPPAAAR